MTQEPRQGDIMWFGLILGPKSTYLHCLCAAQGTCRAVGFGQFALALPVSSLSRIEFLSLFFKEQPCK